MTIFLIKDYGNTLFPDVIPIRTPKYQKLDQKHISGTTSFKKKNCAKILILSPNFPGKMTHLTVAVRVFFCKIFPCRFLETKVWQSVRFVMFAMFVIFVFLFIFLVLL